MNKLLIKPSRYHHLNERDALETSYQALDKIQSLKLSSNPVHFALIYEWLSKADSFLTEQVDILLSLKAYDDNSAFQLFNETIMMFLNNSSLNENFDELINTLSLNIDCWLTDSNIHENNLKDHLTDLKKQKSSGQIIKILQENILPIIDKQKSQTEHLKIYVDKARQEIQRLNSEVEKFKHASLIDELTNIPNRRGFNKEIKEIMQQAQENESSFALLILDIDFFKNINDSYGHLLGDSVLRFLAKFLKHETKGKDLIARIGGEEFVIVLTNTHYDAALKVAEQIRNRIYKKDLKVKSQKEPLKISVSIGASTYQMGESLESLFERADKALYKAKNTGRNKVCGEDEL